MPANRLRIVIEVDDKGRPVLAKTGREIEDLGRRTSRSSSMMSRSFSRVSTSVQSFVKHVLSLKTAVAGLFAAWGASRAVESFIKASDEQAKAVMGVETALRSMGRYTPELSRKLQDLAASLQKTTNFGDEATLQGIKFLVTYKKITDDMLPRSVKVMLDLAALMGGDVVSAANMLGKASMGLTGELRRVGVSVDQNTYKLYGYAGVLKQIEEQVRGQAEAMRRATGSHVALGNAIGDLKEKAGDVLKRILEPSFKDMIAVVERLSTAVETLKSKDLSGWAEDLRVHMDALTRTTLEGIEKIGTAVFKLWDFVESHPDLLSFLGKGAAVAYVSKRSPMLGGALAWYYTVKEAIKSTKESWQGLYDTWKKLESIRRGRGHGASGSWAEEPKSMTQLWKEFLAELRKTPTETDKAMAKVSEFAGTFVKGVRGIKDAAKGASSSIASIGKALTDRKKELEAWINALKRAHDPLYRMRQEVLKLNEAQKLLGISSQEYGKLLDYILGGYASDFARSVREGTQQTKQALGQMSQFAIQAARNMQSAFSDFFFNAMQGKFGDLVSSFKATVDRMVADALAARLSDALFGDFGKTGKMGGIIGSIGSKVFGGLGKIFHFAEGGLITEPVFGIGASGRQYVFGERGPEEVRPVTQTSKHQNITLNIYVSTPDADSFRRSQRQIVEKARMVIGGLASV